VCHEGASEIFDHHVTRFRPITSTHFEMRCNTVTICVMNTGRILSCWSWLYYQFCSTCKKWRLHAVSSCLFSKS